ncbi:MAG: MBL fold metallo-hydrolase [Actinomycetota bacterium]
MPVGGRCPGAPRRGRASPRTAVSARHGPAVSGDVIRRVLAPNPGPFTLDGTNTWIVGRDPSIVIDPGPGDRPHVERVAEEAGPVGAILLTHHHPDHAPGAALLSELTGAAARAWAPWDGERAIGDGDEVRGGGVRLRAVHTPGHTSDHLVFFEPDAGALFTGDAVLGWGTSVVDPPDGDLAAYLRSLEQMRALRPRTLYPGHGPVVDDADGKLREYLGHRAERERQILDGLADGPKTPEELVPSIYDAYPVELHPAAARSVLAHLLKLAAEGTVVRVDRDHDRFRLAP